MIKRILNRHKSSNQNINFKMVLCVFLILIILAPSMPVRATGVKYYYDKYTVKMKYQIESQGKKYVHYPIGTRTFYADYTIDDDGSFVGAFAWATTITNALNNGYRYDRRGPSTFYYIFEYANRGEDEYLVEEYVTSVYKVKDLLKELNIVAIEGVYPNDGMHTDGYWYVKKGEVNSNPTITLTQPSENLYFSKLKLV